MINNLGLELKKPAKPPKHGTNMGDMILDDIARANSVADKQDFANYVKDKYSGVLRDAVEDGINKFKDNFYVEMAFKREKIFKKAFKVIPILRKTCPIPFYGKDLYFYTYKDNKVELIWSIPSKELCQNPAFIPLGVPGNTELLGNVRNYNSGYFLKVYEALLEGEKRV